MQIQAGMTLDRLLIEQSGVLTTNSVGYHTDDIEFIEAVQ